MSDDLQFGLALDEAPEAALPERFYRLGLARDTPVVLTRNRTVLVSFHPGKGLRVHAGYAWAPDEVLVAIIRFLAPRVPRAERLAARRRFLAFRVDRHAPSSPRPSRPVRDEYLPLVERLERLHQILNERHFGGALGSIPVRLSDRMQTRLGEFRADHDGRAVEITLSRRHLRRDGWTAAAETLLHEMVHQWQCETGLPLDHGPAFRRKAREVGIHAAATAPAGYIHAPSFDGTIA